MFVRLNCQVVKPLNLYRRDLGSILAMSYQALMFTCHIFLIFADTHVLKWSTVRIRQFSIDCSTWVVYYIFPHFSVGKFPATGCQFEPRKELMFRWCRVKWDLRKNVWRNGWDKWCEVFTTLMRRILGSTNTPPSFFILFETRFCNSIIWWVKISWGWQSSQKIMLVFLRF